MALRKAIPLKITPRGLSDALDGTDAFPGAMLSLQNLVPDPFTPGMWTPRPASILKTSFGGFTTPGVVTAMLAVGNIVYGMIGSGLNASKDQPFAYNMLTNTFQTITGITNGNTPTTPATSGDWVPPTMDIIGNKIIVTHPGFPGGAGAYFGWFDISGFTSTSVTGNTHSSTLVDNLSANVLQAGWTVGMSFSCSGSAAGTTIVAIASNGLSVTLSQATSTTLTGTALTVAGGTATSPQWAAGNTNGNGLSAVPVAVKQFNGRAYFAVNNAVVFTDSLNPVQVTNATQALVLDGNINVTALGALQLTSATQGGIVQSIIVFKGTTVMYQITGDSSLNNLSVNQLKAATGTNAPNSICSTNKGLAFMSPDGLRIIDFSAHVSDPIGAYGSGTSVPFGYSTNQTRMAAACNRSTYRITVQNNLLSQVQVVEYWYDLILGVWSGPHNFPASIITPWANSFVTAPVTASAKLFQSDTVPTLQSTYVENGVQLQFTMQTCLLPMTGEMALNCVVETQLTMAIPGQGMVSVSAFGNQTNLLGSFIVSNTAPQTTWGNFTWGNANWASSNTNVGQWPINWAAPIVFNQMTISIQGNSIYGLRLGNIYLKYQILGYLGLGG